MLDLSYAKQCDAGRLSKELRDAGLPQAPSVGSRFYGVSTSGSATIVHGFDDLTGSELTQIDGIVDAHVASPLPVSSLKDLAIRKTFAAGPGGSPDDVVIFDNDLPYELRLLDAKLYVTTSAPAATVQLRDAKNGAGNVLYETFPASTRGAKPAASLQGTKTVPENGTVVIRRSDSGVAGEVVIFVQRTD